MDQDTGFIIWLYHSQTVSVAFKKGVREKTHNEKQILRLAVCPNLRVGNKSLLLIHLLFPEREVLS